MKKTLFDARRQKGLSQANLALSVGMSAVAISLLENGKHRPQKNTKRRLEKALDCELKF